MKMITSFGQGGTEGQVTKLLLGLDRSTFETRVACLHKIGCNLKTIEDSGITVREFPVTSLYQPNAVRQMLALARYLRATRTQILHSYNFYSNMIALPAARLAGVPVVIASIRDQGVYMSRAQKIAHKWAGRLADRVLVNADSIRDWLVEEGFQPDKIVTIRNGIDIDRFKLATPDSGIRAEFSIEPDAPLVVMLSRLNPQKGVDDYLKAAALVCRRHPRARFLLVGGKFRSFQRIITPDDAYHARLKRLSERLGMSRNIIFAGRRSDVAEILSDATLSVLPSYSEGIPNSLVESMAAGLPVVATRVGGIPELVRDGKDGYLVPPREPRLLADRIDSLLTDTALARRFGESGRLRVTQSFSLQRMIRDTEELYLDQLLKKNSGTESSASRPADLKPVIGTRTVHKDNRVGNTPVRET